MTTPDIPLLRKVVDWAAHEDALADRDPFYLPRWVQSTWRTPAYDASRRCETAFCIAGYTVEASPTARWASDDPEDALYYSALLDGGDGLPHHAQQAAQRLLGITHDQADGLFHALNTLDDVRRVASRIAGEPL